MTCFYCGTELPPGAMFCGECGRPVIIDPVTAALPLRPRATPTVLAPEPEPFALSEPQHRRSGQSDGATEAAWAEVGRIEHEPLVVEPDAAGPASSEAPSDPAEADLPLAPAPPVEPDAVPAPAAETAAPGPAAAPAVDFAAAGELCAQCSAPLSATDIFCPECGYVRHRPSAASRPNDTVALDPFPWGLPRAPEPAPAVAAETPSSAGAPSAASPAPEAVAPGAEPSPFADDADIERTRIVERGPKGERFVLQFSTGESVSVTGTGLIGRNPIPEPGEYFDSIVTIVDPGKSVSKTHLEFGQDAGAFWISDRFSGNGTLVRQPDSEPKRCEAGKRYRIARGTRVEIGEQFFIVS